MLERKEGNLYLLNGLLLTFLFFTARVICYGAGLWHLWGLRCAHMPAAPCHGGTASQGCPALATF